MTLQQIECHHRHVSPKKATIGDTTQIMICKLCEDFVEVTQDHRCICCRNVVKRSYESENKDIRTIQKTVQMYLPYIEAWNNARNKNAQPCIHIPIGVNIRAVRIEILAEFMKIEPEGHERFLKRLKKESSIVAMNFF